MDLQALLPYIAGAIVTDPIDFDYYDRICKGTT
mgnify:CR=1 FL=1